MADFRSLLQQAKQGNEAAIKQLYQRYQPLLRKYSWLDSSFDEDLYQTLSIEFLVVISMFEL